MSKYRIKECRYEKKSNYRIQKRSLFWWYDLHEYNFTLDDRFAIVFKTYDEAVQYLYNEHIKPTGVHYHKVIMPEIGE